MATKVNLRDIGWMYHAPAKRSERPEILVPPTSQIPGLGSYADDVARPDECNRNLIKDTDTPYIILAKQGGRADLLTIQDVNCKEDKEPQGYPRCDWFYLEDNALIDAQLKEDDRYVPTLPDYMVHQGYNRTKSGSSVIMTNGRSTRPPYAIDKRNTPDTCSVGGRIEEPRAHGYGYRLEKYKRNGKEIPFNSPENETNLEVRAKQRAKQREEQIQMAKLLSFGYENESRKMPASTANQTKFPPQKPKMATTTEYGVMYEAAVVNQRKKGGCQK